MRRLRAEDAQPTKQTGLNPLNSWRPPACATCSDSGWVIVDTPPGSRHQTSGVAVACLCVAGVRLAQGPFKPNSLDRFWTVPQIEAAFPGGTAAAADQAQRERLAAVGLQVRHLGWTLESYKREVVRDDKQLGRYAYYADTWAKMAQNGRGDVVLFGRPGTGKTGLAVSMLRAVHDAGGACRFVVVRDLLERLRASYGDGVRETAAEALEEHEAPDVLVLDEWGGTALTEFARDALTALVDKRQASMRATVFTVNVSDSLYDAPASEQLGAVFGPRLLDRLGERAQLWGLDGPSRRGRKGLAAKARTVLP